MFYFRDSIPSKRDIKREEEEFTYELEEPPVGKLFKSLQRTETFIYDGLLFMKTSFTRKIRKHNAISIGGITAHFDLSDYVWAVQVDIEENYCA